MFHRKCVAYLGLWSCLLLIICNASSLAWAESANQKAKAHSLALDELVQKTLKNNFDIKISTLDVELGKLNIDRTKALYDLTTTFLVNHTLDRQEPSVPVFGDENDTTNLQASANKTFSTGTAASITWNTQRLKTNSTFSALNPSFQSSLEFAVTQPLLKNFLGRNPRLNTRRAQLEAEIIRMQVEDQIETIIASVIQSYWQLTFQTLRKDYLAEALTWAKRLVKSNERNKKLGIAEKSDVLAARANESVRDQDLKSAELSHRRASLALARVANLELRDDYLTSDVIFDRTQVNDQTNIVAEAMANRRDLLIVKKDIEASKLAISVAKNQTWPSLDLSASLTLNGLDGAFGGAQDELFSTDTHAIFVGGVLSYNWDQNEIASTLKREKINNAQKLINMKNVERTVEYQIRDAVVELNAQNMLLSNATRVVKLQRDKMKEEERRLKQGRSTVQTLVRQQDDLINAQQSELAYALNYQTALLNLRRLQNQLLADFK